MNKNIFNRDNKIKIYLIEIMNKTKIFNKILIFDKLKQ
jgi:hypothetical protein